jgi:DNA-binding LytR/AlgR family response regulator
MPHPCLEVETLPDRTHPHLPHPAHPMNALALIAEDEMLLAHALSNALRQIWPELEQLPVAADGQTAIESALESLPDVLFMDIQMPDTNGLDAAETILDRWPEHRALPSLVFVTAYDQYALAAFEHPAVDYLLKPVQHDRLEETCARIKRSLARPGTVDLALNSLPGQTRQTAMHSSPPVEPLRFLQVAEGPNLRMVSIEDVVCFEAADKYVRVLTKASTQSEMLIRTPLRELLPRLDAQQFWQVHRSAVVNVLAIEQVTRLNGRLRIHLRDRDETIEVSRMHAHRFKAM